MARQPEVLNQEADQETTQAGRNSALDDSSTIQDNNGRGNNESRKRGFGEMIDCLDLEELRSYSQRLQRKIEEKGGRRIEHQPYRFQTLYRVLRQSDETTDPPNIRSGNMELKAYLDQPKWISNSALKGTFCCRLPVGDLAPLLERNKDVSYLLFRTYVEPSGAELEDYYRKRSQKPWTPTIIESIRPVKPKVIEAFITMLSAHSEYADVLRKFRADRELPAPYVFSFHHRSDLDSIADRCDGITKRQLRPFQVYIQEFQMHQIANSMISRGRIRHNLVDYLFQPNNIVVYREDDGQYTGWMTLSWPEKVDSSVKNYRDAEKLVHAGANRPMITSDSTSGSKMDEVLVHTWHVEAWRWNFNGVFSRHYQPLSFHVLQEVDESAGVNGHDAQAMGDSSLDIPITDLRVVPLQHCPAQIVDKLRQRGHTFWKCRQRRFVSYLENPEQPFSADERYMIDLKTYQSLHTHSVHGEPTRDELGEDAMRQDQIPEYPFEILLPPKIKGFNLRRKKWYDLMVDRISDISWKKDAFSKIVMDPKAKEIVRALITKQIASERSTDLIAGKGNGLILLLHGGPGTGKTLTAESVAEIAEKPLYQVTCGDIGTKAESVEKYLESVLHLGKLWGCVVLIDEADVYLEQRDLKDLERHALVSVFLRILEYYEGIVILTTNRVGTFDDAFRSRIQLAIHYPTLDQYPRLRIWENFIDRLESFQDNAVNISDLRSHLDNLSQVEMNGREIRNAITTARQYSDYMGVTMTYEHLKDVIETSRRSDRYLRPAWGFQSGRAG